MISKKGHPWAIIAILLVTFLIFIPALNHPFVSWDDEGHITENLNVRNFSFSNTVDIFRSDVNRTYIPLTISSFSLEHRLFGFNPFVFHLNNLILHLSVVLIIYLLALRLGLSVMAAALSALIFAVHPMHVESVVWATQRKDVLYSFFYVLSLYGYVLYAHNEKLKFYLLSLVAGGMSILAKPMALSLPLILLVLDWYLKRRRTPKMLLEKIPFVVLIFPLAWLTYAMNMRTMDFHYPQSVLTWIWCLAFYILKFCFPLDLSVLYQLPQPVTISNFEFLTPVVVVCLWVLVLARNRDQRLLLFASGYFFCSIFFLLRFDAEADLTFVADRFMYLPSLGFCLFLGWGIHEWMVRSKMVKTLQVCLVISLFAALMLLTCQRVLIWGDESKLWLEAALRQPSAVAYGQLGNYYLKTGQLNKAAGYYQKAMAVNAAYSKPVSNYGTVLLKSGQYRQAVEVYSQALKLDKDNPAVIYNNRGYAYLKMGDLAIALDDFDRAIEADNQYIPAYLNKATVLINSRDYSRCESVLRDVLKLDPTNTIALNNLRILKRILNENNAN